MCFRCCKYSDITNPNKTMFANNKEDYNLQSNNNVSYLCTFQLNNYGEILKDTFTIPEYFISIVCLNKNISTQKLGLIWHLKYSMS